MNPNFYSWGLFITSYMLLVIQFSGVVFLKEFKNTIHMVFYVYRYRYIFAVK
jgi:hypothetical protein